jgi:trans-aconitate 2-methyltransferase
MSTPNPAPPQPQDWSASLYLRYAHERTLPVLDLINRLTPHMPVPHSPSSTSEPQPLRIYDLGCGPGNSTSALARAFPSALITGVDTSADMLSKARVAVPGAEFVESDISTFFSASSASSTSASASPERREEQGKANLIFSNATLHWLRTPSRLSLITHLFTSALQPKGVLAFQVPDNYNAPSHALMREVALLPSQPWSSYFTAPHTRVGDLADKTRPDLDPIEAPGEIYDALVGTGEAASVEVWRTEYMHVLRDAGAVVEWVRSTGLKPFLERIGDEGARGAFEKEYERRIGEAYGTLGDGRVMLGYPRLFVVAVRK